ncbi:MAG: SurA N-terminal domain-containing protein [Candidatus Cloacimonetes bacterium]|nr:SurA N-terminal domain-containing protein [Candidatus Cloacimonadota bacterium]
MITGKTTIHICNKLRITILLLALVLFLASCATTGKEKVIYIGKVGDTKISIETFLHEVRRKYEGFKLKNGGKNPNEEEMEKLYRQTWETIIESVILHSQYEKYQIVDSEQEVSDSLHAAPPPGMKNATAFLTKGVFDRQKYLNLLENDPLFDSIKYIYLTAYLPRVKLEQKLKDNILVTEDEIRAEYDIRYAVANVELIHFEPAKMTGLHVSQPEITQYYDNHLKDYAINAECDLNYVIYPVQPTLKDTLRSRQLIDSLYQELLLGEPLSHLATKFSDGAEAYKGGIIGFKELDSLPDSVFQYFEKQSWNGFSKPFRTEDGWKIIEPVQKLRTMVKLRELLIRPDASTETLLDLEEEMILFRELATEIGMKRAAVEYGKKISSVKGLNYKNTLVPGIGKQESWVRQAMQVGKGAILPPKLIESLNSWILIEVAKCQANDFIPLIEVSDEIRRIVLHQKKVEASRQKADDYISLYKPTEITEQAQVDGFPVYQIYRFTYSKPVRKEYCESLNRKLLSHSKIGIYPEPLVTEAGSFVANIINFHHADDGGYSMVKNKVKEQILEKKKRGYFDIWFNNLRKKTKTQFWPEKLEKMSRQDFRKTP